MLDDLGFCRPPIIERDPPLLRFESPEPYDLAILHEARWQRPELRLRFLDGDPRVILRAMSILLGPEGWNAACGLQVRMAEEDEAAEIRVTFAQRGNWSYLGAEAERLPEYEPTMCLSGLPTATRYSTQRRIVLHEVGHAYGFPHEHSTPMAMVPWDEEAVYRYYESAPYYWSRARIEHNVIKRWAADKVVQHEYDPDSIMHYLIPTELLRNKQWVGGGKSVLSALDRQRSRDWYGPPPEYWSEAVG